MGKHIAYLVTFTALALLLFLIPPSSAAFTIVSGIAVGLGLLLIEALVRHPLQLRLAWYAARNYRRSIRVSISYLYRIRIDNDYLLVRSARYPQFGPVGGVYKWNPSARGYFDELRVRDDDFLPIDETSRSDLRVRIEGAKLLRFVRWFESGQNREVGGWREFYEELIATDVLPAAKFRTVASDRIRRMYLPLRYSAYAKSHELFIADIFELLPTEPQVAELRALREAGHELIAWVSEEQISRLGGVQGQGVQLTIGEQAKWTIG